MDFLEVIEKRHSVRKYADKPVEREILDAIVRVAETAPSSRNSKSSAFMIVEDRDTLDALSQMRDYGSALLTGAQAAIVAVDVETGEITVEDTGPGFDPGDLPHLFERFYRGKHAAETNYGIGLALARTIVTAQNGTIQAMNTGTGAKFLIKFYHQVL